MSTVEPLYKKALIWGPIGGIGGCLTTKLMAQGTKVVLVSFIPPHLKALLQANTTNGDRVDTSITRMGHSNSANTMFAYTFDVHDQERIRDFASTMYKLHRDIDCVIINVGLQEPLEFTNPRAPGFSLARELQVMYYEVPHGISESFLGYVTDLFEVPRAHVVFISPTMAMMPFELGIRIWRASERLVCIMMLHRYIDGVRDSLRQDSSPVKMIEVFPPSMVTQAVRGTYPRVAWQSSETQEEFVDRLIGELRSGVELIRGRA